MPRSRGHRLVAAVLVTSFLTACQVGGGPAPRPDPAGGAAPAITPTFRSVDPATFSAPGAQPTPWADVDGDGDLDLFVGLSRGANRLYRNDGGRFVDVAREWGVADTFDTRAAAFGDYDLDGRPDLYVGFTPNAPTPNKLYRNLGGRFEDVASRLGLDRAGTIRQPVFVDYDTDGDIDLFVGFRDKPNVLYRNDGGRFSDVAPAVGLADPRKTIGAAWYDFDQDGDLDLVAANQEGDSDALFRNDAGTFVDVAPALGIARAGRARDQGGIAPVPVDFDNDGDLDLFIASYGPDVLYRYDAGTFTDVAGPMGLAGDYHSVSAAFGDVDNDGLVDGYVVVYLGTDRNVPDHFFLRRGARFIEVVDPVIAPNNGSHGIGWVDYDGDGDLDLALANNHATGTHPLYQNRLPADRAKRSLSVTVVDPRGRHSLAGAEVRVYRQGTRTLLGTRLVDTGSGYNSQSIVPVHFGIPVDRAVDVEVTTVGRGQRRVTRVTGVALSRGLVVKAPGPGGPP
jgi:hypothetical protein